MTLRDLQPESLAAVRDALRRRAGSIEDVAPHAWALPGRGLGATKVHASVGGSWLHFETPLPCRRAHVLPGPRRALGLLEGNAFLPPGMHYCINSRRRGTFLAADMLLHAHDTDTSRMVFEVEELFDSFCSTRATAPSDWAARDGSALAGLHAPLTADDDVGELTRSLCHATGWPYHERRSGQLAITLDTPGQFCQAHAHGVGEHEFRLSTTLAIPADASAKSRHAVATFLLTAARVVRMARTVVLSVGNEHEYRWEVAWPRLPAENLFHRGLSALSIACRLSACELQALSDRSIADSYLLLRGCSSR